MKVEGYFIAIKWVCNTNCSFCNFYETKWQIDNKLHLKELKDEIDNVVNKGISKISIWINWYEPTSFPYLIDFLLYAKTKELTIKLFTNGVKLADNDFIWEIKWLIDEVGITIYSSNDLEHNVLTQNNDSYKLKHKAIKNCLENNIRIYISILLIKPCVKSLNRIILQTKEYWWHKYFYKFISLLAPNTVMWERRNKILVPSYTYTVKKLKALVDELSDELIKEHIKIIINDVIPKCLFNFKYNSSMFILPPDRNFIHSNKAILVSKDKERCYLEKCRDCTFLDKCPWIEKEYLKIYWDEEINDNKYIDNNTTINDIEEDLDKIKEEYSRGMRLDYSIIENKSWKYSFIFSVPRIILWYKIKDILTTKISFNEIKFINEKISDTFFIKCIHNKRWLLKFVLKDNDSKYTKYHKAILLILSKALAIYNNKR